MYLPGRLPGRLGPVEAVFEGGVWVPGEEGGEAPAATMVQGDGFVLEARSPGGAWFGTLDFWGGKVSHALNTWGTLTFSMSAQHPAAAEIRVGCEVWCWRGTELCGRYSVVRAETAAGAERALNVTAADALWRLHREVVPLFYARQLVGVSAYGPQRVDAVLSNLLAQQVTEPAVSLGVVAPSIAAVEVNLRLMGKSIFEWLQEIQKIVGGYYEVTPEGRLNWRASPGALRGAVAGTWLFEGRNLLGLRHEVDFSEYANRVVAVGAGGWYENSLVVTVDDEAAQAAHGAVVRTVILDRGIKDTGTLGLWAGRELAARARARVRLDVDAVDVGALAAQGVALSHAPGAYAVGSSVRVWHEDPEVCAECWVIKATVALDDPARVEVELGDPGETDTARQKSGGWQGLLDAVASIAKQAKTLAGEVDGELEVELAQVREDLAELSAGVAEILADGVPETWAAAVLEEMLQEPPAGPILDAMSPLLQHYLDNLYTPSGWTEGETLPEVLQDHEGRLDALEATAPQAGDEVQPVTAGESEAGTGERWAPFNHKHQGMPIQTFVTGDPLPSVSDTAVMLVELDGEGKALRYYTAGKTRLGSERAWLLISEFEEEEE